MKRIIFLLMFALCSPVIAGPFGFQMGMSIDYISRNIKLKPGNSAGWYRSDSTLVEGLVFHEYEMLITKKYGLCMIMAATKNKRTSPNGNELKKEFHEIMGEFNKKYGPSKIYDNIKEESALRAPDKWVMAVYNLDRNFEAIWVDRAYLSDDYLVRVDLSVVAVSNSVGAIVATYKYENYEECLRSMKEASF